MSDTSSSSSSPASPPGWARAVDFVCLALVALAVIVAVWGGFRVFIGSLRFALTSPYRLWLAALVLGLVRHLAAPQAPIYKDVPSRVLRGWRTPAAHSAWLAFVATRPAILFVGYLAVVMFGYNHERPPMRIVENEIGNLQMRWDAGWYFGIATEGYHVLSFNPTAQQSIVFFPAYPMLMRVAGRVLGGASTSFLFGGTAVSFIAFFWGLTYVFRLARDLLGDDDASRQAVWLVAAYPFAYFFGAVYTESLFLLGIAGTCYHFRRRELVKAGAWGLLVGLTRPNGCFLSIPLAVMALTPWLPRALSGGPSRDPQPERSWAALVPQMLTAAMPGIGMLLYSAFVWTLTGHPLAWAEGHAAWGREYQGFAALLTEQYGEIAHGLYAYTSQTPEDLLNASGVLFVLVAVWPVARRLGLAYAMLILVNILPPLAAGGLLSAGRLSSVLFPAHIWFASVIPARHRTGWLVSFMAVQAFGAALFYTWRELY
ncbi:MAG: hypothetical protein LBQ09_05490 [Acidobacteriaceae bacterium]|jgi:hypothetical protein|nr:hypothetical protein [Acidobacteriaceae bacterium]